MPPARATHGRCEDTSTAAAASAVSPQRSAMHVILQLRKKNTILDRFFHMAMKNVCCRLYRVEFDKLYFYTTTIKSWIPIIGEYHLEPIIVESLNFLHDRGCLKLYGFVIMPNHLHMIVEQLLANGKETPIASFKKFTSHEFERVLKKRDPEKLKSFAVEWTSRKVNFWQPHPDVFELDNDETILQKLEYMHNNPLQTHWNLSKNPIDYFYSSARFYETQENTFRFLYDYRDWMPRTGI
jgi:hypothetical protein